MWLLAIAGPQTVWRRQLLLLGERSTVRVEGQQNLRTVCGEGRLIQIALGSYEKRAKCMAATSVATAQATTIRNRIAGERKDGGLRTSRRWCAESACSSPFAVVVS
ncbi:hypothetical protein GJ744_012483 [Endocarpon pusillum]|uniref:Uncharacterized protein n=1 Tax=Endocarpon pusillum TaxID=364733 RepID=A0A8H7AEX2_9EURO|nr:hypothetical protein GJ744_012483 [Endocarpon pusillum]